MDAKLTLVDRLERIDRLAVDLAPECSPLRGELASRETELRHLGESLMEARRRHADTTTLYVATQRLHSSLDRGQVLRALEEIVASLLGCEQMAVFELIGAPAMLAPACTVGIELGTQDTVQIGEGMIGQVALSGEPWIADEEPWIDAAGRPLTACIPLKVDAEVTGVLALYRLLEHKRRLEPADRELLGLLGTQAATALLATRLRMHNGAGRS